MGRKKKVPDIYETLQAAIDDQVDKIVKQTKEENERLNKTIVELTDEIDHLLAEVDDMRSEQEDNSLITSCVQNLKSRINNISNTEEKSKHIIKFLETLFEPDFQESTYECPIWLSAITNIYSNREIEIKILSMLNVDLPHNIESFRLPQDWTEEELDIVFANMRKHIVCNGCIFKDNLRFWKPNALYSVKKVCETSTYTEIPWQFLLRNPLLKKEKYLKEIGKMAFEQYYISGWRYLFHIEDYQKLSSYEVDVILKQINPYVTIDNSKKSAVTIFLLNHAEQISKESPILQSLYEAYKQDYEFKSKNMIFKFPEIYIEQYIFDMEDPTQWLIRNSDKFTQEQKIKYMEIALRRMLQIV